MDGKIKKIIQKGYGFIEIEGRTKDLYFHASSLTNAPFNSLKEGDNVHLDGIDETPKGEQAYGVKVIY